MKKQVVAVLLSLTLCSATLTEAGAAAVMDSGVVVSEEIFADQTEGQTQTEVPEETGDGSIIIEESEGETEEPSDGFSDNTAGDTAGDETAGDEAADDETANDVTEIVEPEVQFSDELFSSGDVSADQNIATFDASTDNGIVLAASFEEEDEENNTATLLYTRWTEEEGKWKLQKLAKPPIRTNDSTETTETTAADEAVDITTADDETVQESAADTAVPEESADVTAKADIAGEVQTEATVEIVPETEVAAETESETEAVPQQEADTNMEAAAARTVEYYKNQLVTVTTVDMTGKKVLAEGTYYFDENGYLVTGRATVKKGTDGLEFSADTEFYFVDSAKAQLTDISTEAGKNITPYSSDLGQMKKNYWLWDGSAFHNYGKDGRAVKIAGNKIYKIDGQYYYLLSNAKPFVGIREATWNNRKSWYYFKNASGDERIPGRMAFNCWKSRKTPGGDKYMYFGATGRYEEKPAGIYKLFAPTRDTEYVLNSLGYIVKNNIITTPNGSVYMGDRWGWVYKDKVVKWKNARYYFGKDGKRSSLKNCWIKVPNGNKKPLYYYLGSNSGRVYEKHGIQKVTMNNKFVGWFMFDSNGNNLQSAWSGDRYFISDGRMASGFLQFGNTAYFMERSSSTKCNGKKYKSQWIKYNNKYYYATRTGKLYGGGWKTINGGRYYFKNWTAVTNTVMKDPSTNKYGYLNSRGRYETEWIAYNNSKNYARYVDPATGKVYKNMTKTIDGVNYRFDKYGNRVNDRTSEFKQNSYYLECDRINGVMTVYTDSSKRTPIKTIRVSVGNPGTDTPLMRNERIDRADRWQLLMGPSWGQYGTHVRGGIYIHSIACGMPNTNNLPAGEYLRLGSPASHGCIRCCVADAKWVWDNCNGSRITVFDGKYNANECFKGPLGRNPLTPLRGSGTFDPTDPVYN